MWRALRERCSGSRPAEGAAGRAWSKKPRSPGLMRRPSLVLSTSAMIAAVWGWMPAPSRHRCTETCTVPRVMPRAAAVSFMRFARPLFETLACSMTAINCAFGSRLMLPCQPENDGECSSCHSSISLGGSLMNPLCLCRCSREPPGERSRSRLLRRVLACVKQAPRSLERGSHGCGEDRTVGG